MLKEINLIVLSIMAAALCVLAVGAQPGPVYDLAQGLTSSGGGVANDAATSREITGTIAQPIAGTRSSGGAFGLWGGFWGGASGVATASGVSVSGRVTAGGRGVTNAAVTITDQAGVTRTVLTGRSGTFRIDEVKTGGSYVIAVVSHRFTFAPQVVTVSDSVTGIDFVSP